MANINNIYLSFNPSQSNEYLIFNNTDNEFNSDKNIFRYFNTNIENNNKDNKNRNKKIVTNQTNFSKKKGNLRYNTDLNDDLDFIIKNKNFNVKSYFKKIIHIRNLFKDKKNLQKAKNLEENKNNINPIAFIKKFQFQRKSRNQLVLKNENLTSSKNNEKILFSYNSLSSYSKDIFNLKVNLRNEKNCSLYKTRFLLKTKKTPIKPIITEYYSKPEKNNNNNNKKTKLSKSAKKITKYFYPFKTKYIFKCQDIIPTIKFKDLPESVKNINKFYMNSIKSESEKYFGNDFALIKKEKFFEKYRNPLNNELFNEKKEIKEENFKKIKEDIISGQEILNEIQNSKIKITKKRKIKPIDNIYFKFKIWLIKFSEFCKIMLIKPYKYMDLCYKNFNNNDIAFYETQTIKTSDLINSIKNKNIILCNKIIEAYPIAIISKDYFEYTPLHWAVRAKFIEIIPNLILYGADPNAENYLGETPLHISVKNNDYESTLLLLIFMANPFKKNYNGKKPFDLINDYQMKIIYKKIANLYYINTFKRSKKFINNVQNKFIEFIRDEFITPDSKDFSKIIDDIEKEINKGKKKEKK